MKRSFFYAFVTLAIVFNTQAQTQQIYLDSNWRVTTQQNAVFYEQWEEKKGILVGPYREYYISGKLKKEQNYTSEILDGISATYYENGQVESKGLYQKGEKTGVWQEWYENGQLRLKETYIIIDTKYGKRGLKDGIWEEWHENGKLKTKGFFKDGDTQGDWEEWHENEQLKVKGLYENDKKEGVWQEWHKNGQLESKALFKEGNKEGIWEEWHENGKLKSKGNYKKGDEAGVWEYWHENGQIARKGIYQLKEVRSKYSDDTWMVAKEDGLWDSWYSNGQKFATFNYQLGDLTGIITLLHDNGKKAAEYDFDKKVFVNGWDKDGIQLVENGEGIMKHYSFGGKLISMGKYEKGLKTGEWTYYWKDGEIYSKTVIKDPEELTELEKESVRLDGTIFNIVERGAEPLSGLQGFYNYVGSEIKYPRASKRYGHQGKVFLSFVVDKDGSLTFVQVIRGVSFSTDREALRVLRNAPKWTPGTQRGRAVRQKMTLPLTFKLN